MSRPCSAVWRQPGASWPSWACGHPEDVMAKNLPRNVRIAGREFYLPFTSSVLLSAIAAGVSWLL